MLCQSTHAGRIKAYLQFCLAVAAKALNGRAASSRKRDFDPQRSKYDFRVFLLHLGLIGDEFKTARRQQKIGTPRFGRPTGDWDLIHGELVTFTDPLRDLPPIDRLEGFRPGGHSMYQRVMVAAGCRNASIAVWIYRMARVTNGERIDREWRG